LREILGMETLHAETYALKIDSLCTDERGSEKSIISSQLAKQLNSSMTFIRIRINDFDTANWVKGIAKKQSQ
jgi:ribonucleotide reductase beta subunit family protein with ferritin-like domain